MSFGTVLEVLSDWGLLPARVVPLNFRLRIVPP
jgi:hypothetical protein